jgi:predicted amidohydrolase
MATVRIVLANLRYPRTPEDSVARVQRAIAQAGTERAELVCFPECYVPGYRGLGHAPPAPDAGFLENAWTAVGAAAAKAGVAVILGTERVVDGCVLATALVIGRDGRRLGFQDKVQIDPARRCGRPRDGRRHRARGRSGHGRLPMLTCTSAYDSLYMWWPPRKPGRSRRPGSIYRRWSAGPRASRSSSIAETSWWPWW